MPDESWLARIPTEIDQGWAILIAAVVTGLVGFGVIAWQTRTGFKSLIASQENQAKLDREARAHQAVLASNANASRAVEEKNNLAASLIGELSSIWNRVGEHGKLRRMLIAIHDSGHDLQNLCPGSLIHGYKTPVFDANVHRIGVLGPSIAGDVVTVWAYLAVDQDKVPALDFGGRDERAAILKGIDSAANGWELDAAHVQTRLLHLMTGSEDPGPLYFERERRKGAEAVGKTAAG